MTVVPYNQPPGDECGVEGWSAVTETTGTTGTTGTVVRPGEYGERVVAVEPGGVEFIPEAERHGRPLQLFWTWGSPNLEFATIFVGVLAVAAFGLSFWQAVLALLIGNGLGSVTHGLLSARGPRHGVPQMVQSRTAFGYWGNVLPAGLMAVTAGFGWFAVNSVSGAFALHTLTHLPLLASLVLVVAVQVVIAFFGHNLVHTVERYAFPVLALVFLAGAVVILAKSHPGAAGTAAVPGGFTLATGAAFGYTAGWNPYAADYTRYLARGTSASATGWWSGAGMFVSTMATMIVGAASATIVGGSGTPTDVFTSHLPSVIGKLTLLAIVLGAISANVLNIYSGAMSFLTMGVRLSARSRRALVAVVFGAVGFLVAWGGLSDAGHKYESFLLVISYWIGPWLGVVLADLWVSRRKPVDHLLYDRGYRNLGGLLAFLVGLVLSIWLFSNQSYYTGPVVKAAPGIGDLTFVVGFVVSAVLYPPLRSVFKPRTTGVLAP